MKHAVIIIVIIAVLAAAAVGVGVLGWMAWKSAPVQSVVNPVDPFEVDPAEANVPKPPPPPPPTAAEIGARLDAALARRLSGLDCTADERRAAFVSLLGDGPALDRMAAGRLAGEPDPRKRWNLVALLGYRGAKAAACDRPLILDTCRAALADRDAWVRVEGLRGLADIGDFAECAAVDGARASEPDAMVRRQAALALWQMTDRLLGPLLPLTDQVAPPGGHLDNAFEVAAATRQRWVLLQLDPQIDERLAPQFTRMIASFNRAYAKHPYDAHLDAGVDYQMEHDAKNLHWQVRAVLARMQEGLPLDVGSALAVPPGIIGSGVER